MILDNYGILFQNRLTAYTTNNDVGPYHSVPSTLDRAVPYIIASQFRDVKDTINASRHAKVFLMRYDQKFEQLLRLVSEINIDIKIICYWGEISVRF